VVTSCALEGLSNYEFFLRLSAESRDLLNGHARPVHAAPSMFRQEGDTCESVTMLSAGVVRVSIRRPSGREITLYRFGPGDLCVLEVLAVLAGTSYRAEAIIEQAASGVAIPADVFRRVVEAEPELRAFLFRSFEARLALTLALVSDVALGTLDARLAGLLLRHAQGATDVRVTHERLARELACAREAVSRTLGAWERAGILHLGRAHLRIVDTARLGALAGQSGTLPDGR
jgi:CRP/FNR family transcriptional regulator